MSENWKPGDVAMVTRHDGSECRAIRREDDTWRVVEACVNNPPLAFRRLPVPDPESAEDMERLAEIYASATHGELNDYPLSIPALHMQAALREFASPTPPIEEPGKGGVVVAGDGREWMRYTLSERSGYDWVRPDPDGGTAFARWRHIDAVRVLSPGVTP